MQKIHLIATGGSVMHNLAIALHLKGYHVTGSDDAIYEPAKSRLAQHGLLPPKEGWNTALITQDLDAVILGMHARVDNPELVKAQQLGLKIYSYPEFIYEQSKHKTRVVIGGSHGKTTITSMILHVLKYYKRDFDYLVGAQIEGFDTMVKITDNATILIAEGDEYLASPIDRRPKFHLYKAHIGVISGIAWDHINVFPTYENYTEQFDLFLKTIEPNGCVIYAENDMDTQKIIQNSNTHIRKIGYQEIPNEINNGLTYIIDGTKRIPLQIFGNHNLQNLNAAKLVCQELGITTTDFYEAIGSFKGAARRLELLAKNDTCHIFKDFAHSPSKLKATIEAVKKQFPTRKLIASIELHTFSSLNPQFLNEYKGAMAHADEAIVFINQSTFEQKKMQPFSKDVILKAFDRPDVTYFDQPEQFQKHLQALHLDKANLLLMSSGNYGGIDIKNLAEKLVS